MVLVDGLTEYERQYCTPSAQAGMRTLRGLDDAHLLGLARVNGFAAARGEGDPLALAGYVAVVAATGPRTNPTWITAQAAEVAYERELIDERELDQLTD